MAVALRSLRVDVGMDASNYARGASQVESANKLMTDSYRRLNDEQDRVYQRMQRERDVLERDARFYQDMARAANDNERALRGLNLEMEHVVSGIKVATAAAYMLWPAFRQLANPVIAQGVTATGTALAAMSPAAAAVALSIGSRLMPALSLVSRIAWPIMAVVQAFKLLHHTVSLGAGLLDKHADAQRRMFSGSDVEENLNKLTKFQQETLSLQQVQYATELGNRLGEAKKTINDFWTTHIDLNNAALRLQHIWVAIVEVVAKAHSIVAAIPASMGGAAQAIGNSSIWNRLNFGWQYPGAVAPPTPQNPWGGTPQESVEEQRARGMKLLSAAMGNSFNSRFSGDIAALANTSTAAKQAARDVQQVATAFDQYDNAVQRVRDQIAELELQSQWYGRGSEEVLKLKTAHDLLRAAMRAGREDTPALRAEIDALAGRYAGLSVAAREAAQMQSAFTGLGTSLFSAFTSGGDAIEGATRALAGFASQLANQNITRLLNGGSIFGSGNLMSTQGAAGMLGAGAMGYSSGSAMMGVLGGAMAGSAFGPWGMAAGAAIGGIGGMLGGNAQKKQQQQQQMAAAMAIRERAQLAEIDSSTRTGQVTAYRIRSSEDEQTPGKDGSNDSNQRACNAGRGVSPDGLVQLRQGRDRSRVHPENQDDAPPRLRYRDNGHNVHWRTHRAAA